MPLTAVLEPGGDLSTLLYVLAFSLFIVGIKQGTSPTTAKRGNLIAAVGMAVAVITTLLLDGIGNWGVIVGGLLVGGAVGVVASIRVQMTQMPQMVAIFKGPLPLWARSIPGNDRANAPAPAPSINLRR